MDVKICCCCCYRGKCTIKSYFETNTYIPGETAVVLTEVDNSEGERNIKSMEIILL
jgi:hypothetical protein